MKKFLLLLVAVAACSPEPEMKPIPDFPSATGLAAMLAANETTSVAIVTELVARAEANADLNAFITLDVEGALARAAELDEMRKGGDLLGPLHGVPIVVKDNIHVAGLPNTGGTPGLAGFTPSADSPAVASLRASGAIILGKTNLHELAFGITSDNAEFGSVGNPFDRSTFAGGSSGGTGSAIAAGIAPAGLGTDTGGSVRIPAALTGIVGFRPSSDRYDSSAVTPISSTRDTVGAMGRNVADVMVIDSLLAQDATPDVRTASVSGTGSTADEARQNALRAAAVNNASEIRLGVPRSYYYANVDAAASVVIEAALEKLSAAGVTLVEVDPENVEDLNTRSAFPIALYEVVRDLPEYLEEFETGQTIESIGAATASPDVQGLFGLLGSPEGQVPDAVYEAALEAREAMRTLFDDYFESNELDGMIFPTTLLPARPIEGTTEFVELNGADVPTFPTFIHNTDPASIAGLPGISLPAGITTEGLPVGIEIDGPEGSDVALLSVALAVEAILAFDARP